MNALQFLNMKGICTKRIFAKEPPRITISIHELYLFLEEYSKIATFYPFIRNKKKKE